MSNIHEMIIEAHESHMKDVEKYWEEYLENVSNSDSTYETEQQMEKYLKKIDHSFFKYKTIRSILLAVNI